MSVCHSNRWMPPPWLGGRGFMDPGLVQAVFPQVRGQFGRSRCPGQTTVDQVVSTRGPEAWSRRRQAWSWSWRGIGGPVVMHHGPVTLGAAWCLVLGAPGAGQWCAAGHWWVARCCWSGCVFAVAPLLTCTFVISLTFGVSIGGVVGISFWWCLGWWEGVLGVSRPSAWWDVSVTGLQGHYLGSRSGHIRPPGGRSQPLHPGQGERPDRGPDHYRGSQQGETHPAAGATPTQDHGPEEALRSHPGRWRDAPGKTAWTTRPAPLHGALPPVPG